MIARLNMGGPALHVAYLTEGLRERGYDTMLVAGTLARGEDSMAFVADATRTSRSCRSTELGREISPLRDLVATVRLARLIRKERPQILHTHTAKAGTVGRVAARPRRLAPPADRRAHVPRPRPARLLRACYARVSSGSSSAGSRRRRLR